MNKMKIDYRIVNDFVLHPSSKDMFHYFNFKTIEDFQYENVEELFEKLDNFDKKCKI